MIIIIIDIKWWLLLSILSDYYKWTCFLTFQRIAHASGSPVSYHKFKISILLPITKILKIDISTLPSVHRERKNAGLSRHWPTGGLTVPEGIVGEGSGIDLMSRELEFVKMEDNWPLCARRSHRLQQFQGSVVATLVLGGKMSHTCPNLSWTLLGVQHYHSGKTAGPWSSGYFWYLSCQ